MNLHITYSTDNNYAMYTGISMYSLFEHNKNFDSITVHLLINNVSSKNIDILENIANKFNRKIIFYDCKPLFQELSQKIKLKSTQTIAAYGRLYLASLIDESIEKIIYMDGDSLVLGNLKEIWNEDIKDYLACGVLDNARPIVKKLINLDVSSPYINSGFIVFNLKKIREDSVEEKFEPFIRTILPNSIHNDQDVINGTMFGKIKVIHPKFNVMTFLYEKSYKDVVKISKLRNYYEEKDIIEAIKNPVFIHFTPSFSLRPWIKGCTHPMKKEWIKYKNKTVWRDEVDKKDTRRLKYRILAGLYNYLPTNIYINTVGIYGDIKDKIR